MASLQTIARHGFRRWYERQLIECHAWLVTCFLAMICTVSGVEVSGQGTAGAWSLGLALTVAGAVIAYYAWRRYRSMLEIAERLGELAVCPTCQAYAKFDVTAAGPTPLPDGADPRIGELGESLWLQAHCRKCGGEWRM
jgi:hypothetical protein